jgi:hypothetical protein
VLKRVRLLSPALRVRRRTHDFVLVAEVSSISVSHFSDTWVGVVYAFICIFASGFGVGHGWQCVLFGECGKS